jgi:hypothetical protein
MASYHGAQLKVAAKATTPAYTDATATTEINWEWARDSEVIHKHGDPAPVEIKTGHWAVTGTITRIYDDVNFSAAGVKFAAMCMGVISMHISVFPEGDALPKIDLEDCFFNSYSMKAPLNGVIQETAKFDGLLVTVT